MLAMTISTVRGLSTSERAISAMAVLPLRHKLEDLALAAGQVAGAKAVPLLPKALDDRLAKRSRSRRTSIRTPGSRVRACGAARTGRCGRRPRR